MKKKNNICLPFSWAGIGRFFALLGSIGLAVTNVFLILCTWKLLKLGSLATKDIIGVHQLIIFYPLIAQYVLVGLVFICLTALIKGGFNKVKRYDEGGLIFGLIIGLIFGLIARLIAGLIYWLIFGLIIGLIYWLIYGLIFGLIAGLIAGLQEEFN